CEIAAIWRAGHGKTDSHFRSLVMPVLSLPSMQRSSWPARTPTFVQLAPAAALQVPLAASRQVQVIAVRPAGRPVHAGQMLTETAPEAGHVPVAPVAGTLGAVRQVAILGGASIPAVTVKTASAATLAVAGGALSAEPRRERSFARSDLTRADLPGFIDHLR